MTMTRTGTESYHLGGRLTDVSFHGDHGPGATQGVIHDFVVDCELSGTDLVITSLDVRAETHPYARCPTILPTCQELVGHSLASGWRRTVIAALGSTAGCTHVSTLLLGLAEARVMSFFLRVNEQVAYTPETREDGRWTAVGLDLSPTIVGACHALSSTGQLVRDAREVRSAQHVADTEASPTGRPSHDPVSNRAPRSRGGEPPCREA